MKKIAYFLFILSSLIELKAQNSDLAKMYVLNPIQINTAFAFKYDYTTIVLTHTRKWTNIHLAPQQYGIYLILPFQSNMGIQTSIYTDRYGIFSKTGMRAGYFYHTRLSSGTKISMSVTALFGYSYIDKNAIILEKPNDPLINTLENKNPFFNLNTGIHLEHNNYDLGLAIHNLITEKYKSDSAVALKKRQKIFLYSSYSFSNFSGTLQFIPSLMADYYFGNGVILNINQTVIYKKFLLAGIGYSEPVQMDNTACRGLNFYMKIRIAKKFSFGFLYEHYLTQMRSVLGNYQAVTLSYSFIKKQKKIPSYF